MKKINLISVFLSMLIVSACSSSGTAAPTPTQIDVNALQTAVVQTVVANITQTAAAQPTQAPTETPVPATLEPTETVAPTSAASPTAQLCDNSAFVSDASVPDGTQMTAGQSFIKTWKVKNIGTCTWRTSYKIIHAYGEKLSGLPTALTADVLPGGEVEISVNLKAPFKGGSYSGYWRLTNNNGVPFGQIFTVIIIVP